MLTERRTFAARSERLPHPRRPAHKMCVVQTRWPMPEYLIAPLVAYEEAVAVVARLGAGYDGLHPTGETAGDIDPLKVLLCEPFPGPQEFKDAFS